MAETEEATEEVMVIPAGEANQLSAKGKGKDGSSSSTIQTVEARSGAKLTVERDENGARLRIQGPPAKVAKAQRMLKAMLAFSEETTAEERGICKSFASGFCRFGGEHCQDGVHDMERVQKAEEAFLNGGTVEGDHLGGEEPELGQPVLLAIGCEPSGAHRCVGGGVGREGEEEIVEFAVIAICPNTKREVGRFHRFIKPNYWTQEEEALKARFPADCFNAASEAVGFGDLLADILDWLPGILKVEIDDLIPDHFLFVGWRDQEIQTFLPRQCTTSGVDEQVQNIFLSRWASLKDIFMVHFSMPPEAAPQNSAMMGRHLGLAPSWDVAQKNLTTQSASSTGRILTELLRKGWEARSTAWRETVSSPTHFALPSRAGETRFQVNSLLGKRKFQEAAALSELDAKIQAHLNSGAADDIASANSTLPGDFTSQQQPAPPALGGALPPVKSVAPVLGAQAKGMPKPSAPWRQKPTIED